MHVSLQASFISFLPLVLLFQLSHLFAACDSLSRRVSSCLTLLVKAGRARKITVHLHSRTGRVPLRHDIAEHALCLSPSSHLHTPFSSFSLSPLTRVLSFSLSLALLLSIRVCVCVCVTLSLSLSISFSSSLCIPILLYGWLGTWLIKKKEDRWRHHRR